MFSRFCVAGFFLFATLTVACGQVDEDPAPAQPVQPLGSQPPATTGGAVTGSQLAATLDACGLPRTCVWPTSSGSPDDRESVRCVVNELAAGRSLSVETRLVADGGPTGCEVKQGLHFFAGSNVAYLLWRKTCGTTEEHQLKKCTMLDNQAYATCLSDFDASRGSPTGFECSLPSEWMTACTPVGEASCSK